MKQPAPYDICNIHPDINQASSCYLKYEIHRISPSKVRLTPRKQRISTERKKQQTETPSLNKTPCTNRIQLERLMVGYDDNEPKKKEER